MDSKLRWSAVKKNTIFKNKKSKIYYFLRNIKVNLKKNI